jgi:hypothetical protein
MQGGYVTADRDKNSCDCEKRYCFLQRRLMRVAHRFKKGMLHYQWSNPRSHPTKTSNTGIKSTPAPNAIPSASADFCASGMRRLTLTGFEPVFPP